MSQFARKTQKAIGDIDKTDQLESIWAQSGTKEVDFDNSLQFNP